MLPELLFIRRRGVCGAMVRCDDQMRRVVFSVVGARREKNIKLHAVNENMTCVRLYHRIAAKVWCYRFVPGIRLCIGNLRGTN